MTKDGTVTTLHTFTGGDDGSAPGGLVEGSDGKFYGTTATYDGNASTIFSVTSVGFFTTLCTFPDGAKRTQRHRSVEGSDGNFYGGTDTGINTLGTIFQVTPTGDLTTIHLYLTNEGVNPSPLVLGQRR